MHSYMVTCERRIGCWFCAQGSIHKPTTIDDYIVSTPQFIRLRLQELRELIASRPPGTTIEALKWGHPAFADADGLILVVFGGHKDHANVVVTPSALAANAGYLVGFTLGKVSLQVPHDRPIPYSLVGQLVTYRLREYREHGGRWML